MKCEWCGKEFDGRSTRAKFCCDECRHEMAKKYAREYMRNRLKKDKEFREKHNEYANEYGKRKRQTKYKELAIKIIEMVTETSQKDKVERDLTKILMEVGSRSKDGKTIDDILNEMNNEGKKK